MGQRAKRGIGGDTSVLRRTGGDDDPVVMRGDRLCLATRTPRDGNAAFVRIGRDQMARDIVQPPFTDQPRQNRLGLRRQAIAMHVPPGPQVAQHTTPCRVRKPGPDLLTLRAQPIEHRLPALAARLFIDDGMAHPAQEVRGLAHRRLQEIGDAVLPARSLLPARAQAMPRQAGDGAAMPLPVQRCDHIGSRQRRAKNQHARILRHLGQLRAVLRIGNQRVGSGQPAQDLGQRRRGMAGGQHQKLGPDAAFIRQRQHEAAIAGALDIADPGADMAQRAALQRRCQPFRDIAPEKRALRVDIAVFGHGLRVQPGLVLGQPVQKVLPVFGVDRHAMRRDIDAMRRICGRIGQTPAQFRARLDHGQAQRQPHPGQLPGEAGAGEAAANDDHAQRRGHD